eukprot:scaffold983_cov96-Skeletonema_dohrnii-CCMP3373.AAC.6
MDTPTERRVRRRLVGSINDEASSVVANAHHDVERIANQLNGNVLETIFGFLPLNHDLIRLRRVCSDWEDALKQAYIPSDFEVLGVSEFMLLETMTTALPNLQHLSIYDIADGWGRGFMSGDNPDERGRTYPRTHDIGIISNFTKLRSLSIIEADLNGEYPAIFNFPLLEKLSLHRDLRNNPNYHKWDLELLAGLPMLRELECFFNQSLTGNLSSLRVLKDTLEKVEIENCPRVAGNFMDLADFPHLKVLYLNSTYLNSISVHGQESVSGDIRDIGATDFTALTKLTLPRTVYGGNRYEFQSIAEVPVFMRQMYPLAKRFSLDMFWRLSNASLDWYDDSDEVDQIPPPFVCELITLRGTRIGWRWRCNFPDEDLMHPDYCPTLYDTVVDPFGPLEFSDLNSSCEINWLEPEPVRERSDYKDYTFQLGYAQREINFYRGCYNPPTEDEYNQLLNVNDQDDDFGDY